MKKKDVISLKCLPSRPPLMFSVVLWLLLDRLDSPGWVQGVSWTLAALLWLGWVVSLASENPRKIPGFGEER